MRAIEKLLVSKRLLLNLVQDFTPVAMFQSFSLHDLVLTDLIMSDLVHDEYKTIHMFTISPGQLPAAIMQCIEQLNERYGEFLKVYPATDGDSPHARRLEHGSNKSIYPSLTTMSPLKPALAHKKALISTIDPISPVASYSAWIVWDSIHRMPRFNPVTRWTYHELADYARHYHLPQPPYPLSTDKSNNLRSHETQQWWQPVWTSEVAEQPHVA